MATTHYSIIWVLFLFTYSVGFFPSTKFNHLKTDQPTSQSLSFPLFATLKNDISVSVLEPVRLTCLDTLDIVGLAYNEFAPECKSFSKQSALLCDILAVYLPKLFLPASVMGHDIYGFKVDDRVIAMVDVSLQTASGSMDALGRTLLSYRMKKYPELAPYISNFLVMKEYRRQGFGRKLITEVENIVSAEGHNEVNLHVDCTSLPAMAFYISLGYEPRTKFSNNIVFMKKIIRP
jgi:GNAT superfamily N-acetyltransferase